MDEWIAAAFLVLREWAESEFVVKGVDFNLVFVGSSEFPEDDWAYFKIQYANGEINAGDVLEVHHQKSTGRIFYSQFTVDGMLPTQERNDEEFEPLESPADSDGEHEG